MSLRSAVRILLILAIALPIVSQVLQLVAGLLISMQDATGASAVRGVATACVVLWPVALVGLLLAVAYDASGRDGP